MGSPRNVFGEFSIDADNPIGDAYGRLRTSNPQTIFESKQIVDNSPLYWDEELESGAGITSAYDENNSATVITSTANTAGKFTRQTFMHHNYRPGKSQLIYITGNLVFSGGGTDVSRKMGQFDDENGIYVEVLEGTPFVVQRSSVTGSVVEDRVPASEWNLDSLDGSAAGLNPSQLQLLEVMSQIVVIDYEWLSVGRVRVGFILEGVTHYVHEFNNANTNTGAYMTTANLPLRYQMETSANSPVSEMLCSCSTVISEGGAGTFGFPRYKSTEGIPLVVTTLLTNYALIGIRLKPTHIGAAIDLIKVNIQLQTGARKIEWCLVSNPVVAGTFTYVDEPNSSVQIAIGATANTVTGGVALDGGFVESGQAGLGSGSESNDVDLTGLQPGSSISDVLDEWVVLIRPVSAMGNSDVEGSIGWRELQ